jgi:hypothetical protein
LADSDPWTDEFKKHHNIVSRKITKLVSKQEMVNKNIINKSVEDFVTDIQNIVSNYNPNYVLNIAQSGLQLEMFSDRTLSYRGEKLTLSTGQAINKATHSYKDERSSNWTIIFVQRSLLDV